MPGIFCSVGWKLALLRHFVIPYTTAELSYDPFSDKGRNHYYHFNCNVSIIIRK